jgi:hypothetical protein
MTASTSFSVFHQWLLAEPSNLASACAIILHGEPEWSSDSMIRDIANYLNEYDDDGDGRWLPATPELIEKILRDPNHRRLLGMEETTPSADAEVPFETRKTISAIGQRGHVVLSYPGVPDRELDLANTFHAGIGDPATVGNDCHVILNPKRMDEKCIAHVIADVFLEWLHCEMRQKASIYDIR